MTQISEQRNNVDRILVVDDEESIRVTFTSFLQDAGYRVETAGGLADALDRLVGADGPDLVVADIVLGDGTGLDIVQKVMERDPYCPVVLVTGNPNVETASAALRLGAFDYIAKPVKQDMLLRVTRLALEQRKILLDRTRYRMNLEAIFRSVKDSIITVDPEMHVMAINRAARTGCGFLGASTTGQNFMLLATGCSGQCATALKETIENRRGTEVDRFECRRDDGERRIVSLTTSPLLDDRSAFSGAVMVIRDETRMVELERDLGTWRQFHSIVGRSEGMRQVFAMIRDLASVPTTVLVTGESGTGKELVANALHFGGSRRDKPLVKVDCMSIPEGLLESELFGHVKGAFTGAHRDRVGRFERADGGTIFLDEIGDIPPQLQLRLLRVLQEREFQRVGGSRTIRVDVRVVAATNRDLKEKVRRGEFREDLLYRLNVVELRLPPLRERREDIPLLVEPFLKKYSLQMGKDIIGISADVEALFMGYNWPGNVRELENVLEHACVRCRQHVISVDCLPADLRDFKTDTAAGPHRRLDKEAVLAALEKTAWNKARAARALGVSRQTMYRKLKEFDIRIDGG